MSGGCRCHKPGGEAHFPARFELKGSDFKRCYADKAAIKGTVGRMERFATFPTFLTLLIRSCSFLEYFKAPADQRLNSTKTDSLTCSISSFM